MESGSYFLAHERDALTREHFASLLHGILLIMYTFKPRYYVPSKQQTPRTSVGNRVKSVLVEKKHLLDSRNIGNHSCVAVKEL
jgi:hypothetical protein